MRRVCRLYLTLAIAVTLCAWYSLHSLSHDNCTCPLMQRAFPCLLLCSIADPGNEPLPLVQRALLARVRTIFSNIALTRTRPLLCKCIICMFVCTCRCFAHSCAQNILRVRLQRRRGALCIQVQRGSTRPHRWHVIPTGEPRADFQARCWQSERHGLHA